MSPTPDETLRAVATTLAGRNSLVGEVTLRCPQQLQAAWDASESPATMLHVLAKAGNTTLYARALAVLKTNGTAADIRTAIPHITAAMLQRGETR